MTIQLTIYILSNDYRIEYIQMTIQLPYTWPNDYTIDYIHS